MTNKASFKLRYLAFLTDQAINLLLVCLGIFYVANQPTLPAAISATLLFLILIVLNPLILYQSIIFTHYFQGTLGKLLTGLRVTSEKGEKLSFKRIAFRQTIGYSFSTLIFGLGFYSMIKDDNKQTWHDKAIGSIVVVKQKLWPLALLALIILIFLNGYFITQSITTFTSGPLLKETQVIIQNVQQEIQKSEKKQQQKPYQFNPRFNPQRKTPQTPASTT